MSRTGVGGPSAIPSTPSRFHSLDVLRGLAALSVVLWHWQHFYAPFNPLGDVLVRDQQPGYAWLYLFYQSGDAAVQLFFCLSGFIFFWLYGGPIAERRISLGQFTALRLSRLYPLHLVTLLLVAAGQARYANQHGATFVYQHHDVPHFVLQLLFAAGWGHEQGGSFNGPVWSVSVEVLIYAVFFGFARLSARLRAAPLIMLVLVVLGYLGRGFAYGVGLGLTGFFMGGLVYLLYARVLRSGHLRRLAPVFGLAAAVAWGIAFAAARPGAAGMLDALPWYLRRLVTGSEVLVLFPLTILALACLETVRGSLGRRMAWLGDLSYSTYLLHFPLQLAVVLVAAGRVPTGAGSLVVFLLVLLALAFATHHGFERPMQRAWRRHMGLAGRA